LARPDLVRKAETSHELERAEITVLLRDGECDRELFEAADRVRRKYVGDAVHLRGLIEITNRCSRNCLYCGLRRDNNKLERYRLAPETIIRFASKAVSCGCRTIVLQGGEGDFYSQEEMGRVIGAVKKMDAVVTLSLGEKKPEEYRSYLDAGAD
jgi:biotin synthase